LKPVEILQKYWKHEGFRLPQEEIINSVLEGNDTLALLPTGGGKSICFQVPALMKEGICLVISPLIALMKDQVKNLEKINIKAIALTGGISTDEMIDLLDNCQFGNYKFLYLSPERLQNEWILDRIKSLPINLIAIDEAHCVSQWGHDFRPAYLKINILKKHFTKIPFLALTASATARVKDDVIQQLELTNTKVFTKSFERKNLAYMVLHTQDKLHLIEQILTKNKESAIIYVTNRKACLETSYQLEKRGFTATFYHGGLQPKEKDANMSLWMTNKAQVIVATNAFGMGIDKPDVKSVIHLHLPPNLENYYQEAGRAGRNEQNAYAVLLINSSDTMNAESQFISVLSDKMFLKSLLIKLYNYFQIAYGEGFNEQFSFNLHHFCSKYSFPILKSYQALQFLDRQGVLTMTQEFSSKVALQFIIPSKEVIRYISLNPSDEPVILALLRTNPGIYESKTAINVTLIAKKSGTNESTVLAVLHKLEGKNCIELFATNNDATILFNEVREDEKNINRISKILDIQNNLKKEQFQAVLNYINETKICKSKLLLNYFGEQINENCGICSYCIATQNAKKQTELAKKNIVDLLQNEDLNSRQIEQKTQFSKDVILDALKYLLDNDTIYINPNNDYSLK
jgi:ATP-dependent DNA helicase RecQ